MRFSILVLCLLLPQIRTKCVVDYDMICDQISDLTIYGNNKLSTLVIGNNNKIPSETLKEDTFKDYPNLEELTIISTINKLETEAFKGLSKLLVLKLYKNSIGTLTDFTFIILPHLTKLDLQNNNIQYINTTGPFIYTNLKTVNLSFNKLRYLNWQAFAAPGLERLLITHNEIMEIGNHNVFSEDLLLLNLDHNKLFNIEGEVFNNLQKLEELVISNNRITMLWTKGRLSLQSLLKLNLSHNQIVQIDENYFSQLPKLKNLYLNHNFIKRLPSEFSQMKLYTLHLHSNRLQNIEMIVIHPTQYLQELTVANNPIPCTCMDNIFLYMELQGIKSTACEDSYLKNGSYPTCVGTDSAWSHGKCILSEPIDDYIYDFFDKNTNPC
ncbi:hypothetical protein RN001_012589 [Aquatica leii]|uniref:Uncharacterized protein n=1 Tax=Aquatica leii TaxID=1421715 RepID=A0AAN7SDE1_9COLE|nr:hypothetical protein RN001_012589 [Aquatica leii]